MTVIAVAVVLIIFILVFIYSLVRISSREDDLAEQEKYMKQLIEMKEKEEEEYIPQYILDVNENLENEFEPIEKEMKIEI